jgi:hypothetical protein
MKVLHHYRLFSFSLLFIGLIGVILFSGSIAEAVTVSQYQQLENIPGTGNEGNKTFPEYVATLYNLGLWIVGISAMFMLTVGGFMYLTSAGNTSAAGTAKGVIKDALIGLTLGLFAWLIVNTINPDLTTLNVSGLATGTSATPPAGGGTLPPAPSDTIQQAASQSNQNKFASSGDCKNASGTTVSPQLNINEVKQGQSMTICSNGCDVPNGPVCTGKVNPSEAMISAINSINSGYQITSIAGGSHGTNSAHYAGKAIDIEPGSGNKAQWIEIRDAFIAKGALPNNPNGSGTMCESKAGTPKADCVGADHIHVRFP